MKFIDEFRDPESSSRLIRRIRSEAKPDTVYRFMEFCGGHTHTLARHGIKGLLGAQVQMIHGPGCPVCVLPTARIDMAIDLALNHKVTLAIYGDCLKVPGSSGRSLETARALGASVEVVHGPLEALELAQRLPSKEVVFLAIGFETTTPPSAHLLLTAKNRKIHNLSLLSNHVLTPPAMQAILSVNSSETNLDGIIGPAHVSVVIGLEPYRKITQSHQLPIVVAGFEPLDMLQAIWLLIRQVNEGTARIENEFSRAVGSQGNEKAQKLVSLVFETRNEFEWRGLGSIPFSGLKPKPEFRELDAEVRFDLINHPVPDHKACECSAILRGIKEPKDCKVFGTACTPDTPLGACMVSSEGACAAEYLYGRNPGAPR